MFSENFNHLLAESLSARIGISVSVEDVRVSLNHAIELTAAQMSAPTEPCTPCSLVDYDFNTEDYSNDVSLRHLAFQPETPEPSPFRPPTPPTLETEDYKAWYKHGELHRDGDLPAKVRKDGIKEWYKHGQLHRKDDLPAIEYYNGGKEWYSYGKRHRANNQPAIERSTGDKEWWVFGSKHRDNGPAIELACGYKEWYLNDVKMTEEEFNKRVDEVLKM